MTHAPATKETAALNPLALQAAKPLDLDSEASAKNAAKPPLSASRWTTGKWSVSNGRLIRVVAWQNDPRQALVVCGVHRIGAQGGIKIGDPLANAKLIALAPEMAALLCRFDAGEHPYVAVRALLARLA